MDQQAKGEGKPSPHVFIAVPSFSGRFAPECLDSIEGFERLARKRGWGVTMSVVKGDCYIQRARNDLVHQFMQSDATDLLFIDDDVGFPPEAAVKLVEMEDAFVFGVYPFKREEEGYPVVIHTNAHGYPMVREDGCIMAAGAPTGFMRLKRSVFTALEACAELRKYHEVDESGETTAEKADYFPQGVRNGRWWGEDFAFCNLWSGIMGQIWCVPDIDFVHVGRDRAYHGNYHRFLLNCPKE